MRLARISFALHSFALVLVLSSATSQAADVNKCVVDGKTTYQSEPCKNASEAKAVHLDAGLSKDQQREAQNEASRQFFAGQAVTRNREQAAMNEQYAAAANRQPAKVDCAKLNDAADRAKGDRNGMIKYSKDLVLTGDAAAAANKHADEVDARISATQQTAAQNGCR